MEVKVEVSYVVGNKSFTTAEEALAYERSCPLYQMFDDMGRKTDTTDDAVLVHLPYENATRAFINKCKEEGNSYCGIDSDDTGWWWWSWRRGEYVYLDSEIIDFFTARGAKFDD